MILPRCASAATVILLVYVKLCLSDYVPALLYENVNEENGYHFRYITLDSDRKEKGSVAPSGKTEEEGTLRVEGSYSFVAPDGKSYKVVYVSDENGFRPKVSGGTAETGSGGFKASPALIASLAGGGLG